MESQKEPATGLTPEIKVAGIPATKVFPLYLHELDELANGAPLPLYFNLAIFLFSLSGSLIGSILVPIFEKGFNDAGTLLITLFGRLFLQDT